MCGIFSEVNLGFGTVVAVVIIVVVEEPSCRLVVMFIHEGDTELAGYLPSLHVVRAFAEGAGGTYDLYFRILFFDSLEYHGETFFKHRRDEVFVAHTEIFQVEGFRVSGFRTHLGPWAFGRVAVSPFDEVQYAFYIFRHFFHGDAHLACASDGRVLATHTGCNDGQRFRPDVLAE